MDLEKKCFPKEIQTPQTEGGGGGKLDIGGCLKKLDRQNPLINLGI